MPRGQKADSLAGRRFQVQRHQGDSDRAVIELSYTKASSTRESATRPVPKTACPCDQRTYNSSYIDNVQDDKASTNQSPAAVLQRGAPPPTSAAAIPATCRHLLEVADACAAHRRTYLLERSPEQVRSSCGARGARPSRCAPGCSHSWARSGQRRHLGRRQPQVHITEILPQAAPRSCAGV
jgi:hypothetical protein